MFKNFTDDEIVKIQERFSNLPIVYDRNYLEHHSTESYSPINSYIKMDIINENHKRCRGRKTKMEMEKIMVFDNNMKSLVFTYNSLTLDMDKISKQICPSCGGAPQKIKNAPLELIFGYTVKVCIKCKANSSHLIKIFKRTGIYDRLVSIVPPPSSDIVTRLETLYDDRIAIRRELEMGSLREHAEESLLKKRRRHRTAYSKVSYPQKIMQNRQDTVYTLTQPTALHPWIRNGRPHYSDKSDR